ncbi:MFS transporter [Bifidobacterium kimbladii]|uniref:MFS transporter, putative macrolide (Erythromycin, oleando-mycin, azithromycin) efflux, MefA n=1 Tax=Bifidobacterium asteroides TaxID=1684 RepID=A0A0F4KT38_9BIFI|nr:MFS transporter [Bifidobacterium asteroides]KJY49550.1 MFS transporter, putative macrolide (Erythromycin, oleando-mycin, azithromycin) efflux, MefA [Bifidobacterium asteroides]
MNPPDQAQTSSKGLLAPPFIALLTTEILSNLGQTCLVFALPLHLLNISGSASLYGMASAMAVLPSILLTPLGGALADRLHKQSTMAVLDILSALTAFLYILISRKLDPVFLTVTCMMLVNAYRACYSPTVQAALHCLVDSKDLTRASALVSQAISLVGMIGPVLAGMVMGIFGIMQVVGVSASVCLLSAAWIRIAVRIPEPAQSHSQGPRALVSHLVADTKTAAQFLVRNSNLKVVIGLSLAANLIFASYINVALPYMVTRTLGLSNAMQGLAEGILACGSLLGAILVSIRPGWFYLQRVPVLLSDSALVLLPIVAGLLLHLPTHALFALVTGCMALAAGMVQTVNITSLSYEQIHTPAMLIGKVIGLTNSLCMCAIPLGQASFGPLIDHCPMTLIITGVVMVTLLTCLIARLAMKPDERSTR